MVALAGADLDQRELRRDEERGASAVIISDRLWREQFDGAPDVLGRTLRVNGQDLTNIGVAPDGFLGTVLRLRFDLWLPATL